MIEIIKKIKNRLLLIDANFLFDALRYETGYYHLLRHFEEYNINTTTITPVLIEYYKGINTKLTFTKKKKFSKKTFKTIMPIDDSIVKNSIDILPIYREKGKDLSATDVLLAGTLKKYKNSSLLLTRDHSDFPTFIFDRIGIINIELESEIRTYAVIKYSEGKYRTAIINFNRTL